MSKETQTDHSGQHQTSGDTEANEERADPSVPDFSCLPDVVWMEVQKCLSVQDRFSLSQTCRKLHTLFSSPGVWKSVSLNLTQVSTDLNPYSARSTVQVLPWQRAVLERFGHCIQHLTLTTKLDLYQECYSAPLSASVHHLKAMKSLTVNLECGQMDDSFFQSGSKEQDPKIYNIISTVCQQRPQCVVHVDYTHTGSAFVLYSDVFKCSASDLRCKHLRSLTIMHSDKIDLTDEELGKVLLPPRSSPTSDLVSMFPSIQHLSLDDFFMSDHLLHTLADTYQKNGLLRTLSVYFNSSVETSLMVNNLSSAAWSRLVSGCPRLQVFFSCESFASVARVIKPEAPLVGISICGCFMGKDVDSFDSFWSDHRSTLQEFSVVLYNLPDTERCQSKPGEMDIVSVVKECPKLVDLHYDGPIHRDDIIKLAELGRKWKNFWIQGGPVLLTDEESERCATTEELEELKVIVSQRLGFPWQFIPLDDDDDDYYHDDYHHDYHHHDDDDSLEEI